MTLAHVAAQCLVIVGFTRLVSWAGRFAAQPRAVGEILGGLLLGPSFFGLLFPAAQAAFFPPATQPALSSIAKLGLTLLLFQAGLEFDFGHAEKRRGAVVAISAAGILVPAALGLALAPWLALNFSPGTPPAGFTLFVTIAMSISALPVMARILLERGLERTALGALALSAAAIDDLVGWLLLAAVTALSTAGFRWGATAAQAAGLAVFCLFVFKAAGPWLARAWRRAGALTPSFLALLLVSLFACSAAAGSLGAFDLFGAFVLGVSLHRERELAAAWRGRFGLLIGILVPVFFASTGLRTDVGLLHGATAWTALALVFLAAAGGKLGACALAARATGSGRSDALCVGVLMNTRGLMELVALNVGRELGLLSPELFTIFVLMALATTLMTGPLLRLWGPR